MLDIGWSELFVIAALALLVLGPKDLTRMAFMIGHWIGQARQSISDIRAAFEDMAEDLESDKASDETPAPKIAPPSSPPPPPPRRPRPRSLEKSKNLKKAKNLKNVKSQKTRKKK